MSVVIGEATSAPSTKQQMFLDALQQALDNAPSPGPGTDIQHFRLVSVELEFGGFMLSTKTRVTLDVHPGPLEE